MIAAVVFLFDSTAYVCLKVVVDDFAQIMISKSENQGRGELRSQLTGWLVQGGLYLLERGLKNAIQLIIGQIVSNNACSNKFWLQKALYFVLSVQVIFKFYPRWNDRTGACNEALPGAEWAISILATIAMWLLLPIMLHFLLNTFVYGQVSPKTYMNTMHEDLAIDVSKSGQAPVEIVSPEHAQKRMSRAAMRNAAMTIVAQITSAGKTRVESNMFETQTETYTVDEPNQLELTTVNPIHDDAASKPNMDAYKLETAFTDVYSAASSTSIFSHKPEFWQNFSFRDKGGFINFFVKESQHLRDGQKPTARHWVRGLRRCSARPLPPWSSF